MSISTKTRKAYSEICEFIKMLNYEDRKKIPNDVINFFEKEKDKEYIKKFDLNIPIYKQNLIDETYELIAFINLEYLCDSNEEKERLKNIYNENEKKINNVVVNSINIEDIFKERKKEVRNEIVLVKKGNFFNKILKKIRKIFKIEN